jgi:hypothetical protein
VWYCYVLKISLVPDQAFSQELVRDMLAQFERKFFCANRPGNTTLFSGPTNRRVLMRVIVRSAVPIGTVSCIQHRTPNIRTDFPMLNVGNAKCSDPGRAVAN